MTAAWEWREIEQEWDARWDTLAGNTPEAGFMQSSRWADFKRREGYAVWRYGLFASDDGETLYGGATLYAYPADREEGFLLCPEGPVLSWHNLPVARVALRGLLQTAQTLAETHGGLGLRIEPHLPPPAPSLLRNWTRAPVDLTPIHTLLTDVTPSDDILLSRLSPKARYNLKLAQRHGVSVRRSRDLQDVRGFYTLFEETARRNDFFAEPYGFFLNLGTALFPSGQAELFLADFEGETIAAILVVFYGRRATYLYGGSTARLRRVMPNHALHWAAIQAARLRGCIEYDWYGYDPFGLPSHQYAGISRFKTQWGGTRGDSMGARDYLFYDRLADRLAARLSAG